MYKLYVSYTKRQVINTLVACYSYLPDQLCSRQNFMQKKKDISTYKEIKVQTSSAQVHLESINVFLFKEKSSIYRTVSLAILFLSHLGGASVAAAEG